jgi:hypothetical protein
VTEKLSESMNIIANEPSLAFFRIQEHVRKCLPQLAETKVNLGHSDFMRGVSKGWGDNRRR